MKSFEDRELSTATTYCKRSRSLPIQESRVSLVRCDANEQCDDITSNFQYSTLHNPSSLVTSASQLSSKSACILQYCGSSTNLCSGSSYSPVSSYVNSPASYVFQGRDSILLRSVSHSSDDDMNVNSPDSGFQSITPSGRSSEVELTDDELSRSPSSSIISPPPLNLASLPPKPSPKVEIKEPTFLCKWKNCTFAFTSQELLQDHVGIAHVDQTEDRFCCLWIGCRAYDKPARSLSWLQTHVTVHTGKKRFKCVLEGCGATFSTQLGVARHVPSHFNENIPKARVANHAEKKCLVKKRRIRNETKALANVHDCMDRRCMELIQKYLVQKTENLRKNSNHFVNSSKRVSSDGSLCFLNADQQWSKDACANNIPDEALFLSRPAKRCRKYKATS